MIFYFAATQKKLFTPGPLEVSYEVKYAMLKDLGHRDAEFGNAVKFIRSKLLEIAGVSEDDYTTVPLQGSGTFAVEAVIGTTIPRESGKILVITNGAYGKRIVRMVEMMGYEKVCILYYLIRYKRVKYRSFSYHSFLLVG